MGRRKFERLVMEKKRKQKNRIIGIVVSICAIALIAIIVIFLLQSTNKTLSDTLTIQPDTNGDLRIPINSLSDNLNYVDYGGREELMLWKYGDGTIGTALDTCETCYYGGNIHFTLSGQDIICNLCGTSQSVTVIGTEGWGGCKPISITNDMRNDTDAEVVIPSDVLAYADDIFAHWDEFDYDVTFATYGTNEEHTHD